MLPHAVQVADPFHVVKLANTMMDEVRRRVQNETLGDRGHASDPLYRARKACSRQVTPMGEVTTAWPADKKSSEASTATTTPRSQLRGSMR